MRIKIPVLLQCIAFVCTQSVSAVNIEMVTVGNPGNAPDMRYNLAARPEGYGAVNYVYQIGKYEITNAQYVEFLNAVAGEDPNYLYNLGGNIQRSGTSPNFSYSVAADWAERPVAAVSFWNSVRFCNWLHNGQPIGHQGPETTEGGAYHDIGSDILFGRNANAKFFIPTEDEWYKAAYHDKSAGLAASYFKYPVGNDDGPTNDPTETFKPGNNANIAGAYGAVTNYAIGNPYWFSKVGEFELSDSPYGTFDQAGNIWEWNETAISSVYRGYRGGWWHSTDGETHAKWRPTAILPSTLHWSLGFRIAAAAPVPEPSCAALFSVTAAMMLVSRGRTPRG